MKSKFTAIVLSLLFIFSFVSCSIENAEVKDVSGQGYTKENINNSDKTIAVNLDFI